MDFFSSVKLIRFDQPGSVDDTPLHMASYAGRIHEVMLMLATDVDVNVRGDIGNTPIFDAVIAGQVDVVQALLKAGANPFVENDYGDQPLDFAGPEMREVFAKMFSAAR